MENNSIKYIVYCTTNNINKYIYVGVHETNPDIFDNYLGDGVYANMPSTYAKCKYKFHAAVKQFGPKNFIRSTIAIFNTLDEALALEGEIVNEEFLKRTDVYNTALGGRSGGYIVQQIPCYQYSETGEFETEYKSISYASKVLNRNLKTVYNAIKNKTKCANHYITTKKYDTLDLSKMHNYEGAHKVPIYQYDELGKYECCYDSIVIAAKVLNFDETCIGRAAKLGSKYKNKYFSIIFNPEFSNAKSDMIVSRPVHQYDIEGKYIRSYKNMQEAKNILHIKNNIYSAIKLGQLCGGYQWSFEKLDSISPIKPKSGRPRKIGQYSIDGNLIKEFPSIAKCKRETGIDPSYVLRGRDKTAKGYVFKYLD